VRARGSRYIEFFIPGLLGMSIMSSSLWGIGWTLVQARRRKLLKQLVATPMRRAHYLVAQIGGRLFFLLAEVGVIALFGALIFDVTVAGSLPLLAAICLLGAISFAGMGLLLASRTHNAETVSGLINLLVFPMTLLSGVFFSTARFPEILQGPIRYLPLTALNDALRAVYNGAALTPSLAPLGLTALVGIGSFLLALRIFRWT
jgi:ABC-type multidrug transport system permease subunit